MRAGGSIAVVEESKVDGVNIGEIVQGGMHGGWQEYFIMPASDVVKIPQDTGLPLTAFISVLGFTGPTAYFGFLDKILLAISLPSTQIRLFIFIIFKILWF